MTEQMDHGGIVSRRKGFSLPWLANQANQIEKQFQDQFHKQGVRLRVLPLKFPRLRTVGEGVGLSVFPYSKKDLNIVGDFEAQLEIRRRRRFGKDWTDLREPADVEAWLRAESHNYLSRLEGLDLDGRRRQR